jgi:hypothetical protein
LDYNDLVVDFKDAAGKDSRIYFDSTYSPTLGPMHEDCEDDAIEWTGIGNERRLVKLYVLAPLDLAVSKLGRFDGNDPADILDLAAHGYFTANEFRARSESAASYFVGDVRRLRNCIEITAKRIEDLDSASGGA